jgi:hypothetical protein
MPSTSPRYGTPNYEMLSTWVNRAPEDDGPFWALNLMRYKPAAEYADGRESALTGREADDAYSPLQSLAAVGAVVALFGDVTDQRGAEPRWDRVAIVRYPTHASFLAMQRRDDFKHQHAHKEAGMDFTIIVACLPDAARPPADAPERATLVLRVARLEPGAALPEVAGATRVAAFDVEGVIVGDERTWSHAVIDAATADDVVEELLTDAPGVEEAFSLVLARPGVDALTESIRTASV